MISIAYEDDDLLVCVKPAGILSQPGPGGGEDMMRLLKTYFAEKGEGTYVGLIHRLDRNVGGLMVFAKSEAAASRLSQAVRDRDFVKEYLAVVHGCPEKKAGTFLDLLFRDSAKNKTFVVTRARKGVKEASLEYEVLGAQKSKDGDLSLVKIRLHTGRTHQIRVQFASRKMPLVGDGKYGGRDNAGDIALWSYRLAFPHPLQRKRVDIRRLPPNEAPWDLFPMDSVSV